MGVRGRGRGRVGVGVSACLGVAGFSPVKFAIFKSNEEIDGKNTVNFTQFARDMNKRGIFNYIFSS
ncbi:hypothetical protein [Paenibacillus sp. Soil766]|uniref:hypothetical protein n=1 Tax=Paenibacillus sp. Soil766 TaxID=1736404 RepID=UPI001F3F18F8|nr:hypothetical protein [Paenibacillus sp. Soil766]